MRRREFIQLLPGVAAAWPLRSLAQQPVPVVGFLRSTPSEPFMHLVDAFRAGLKEVGFVEGRNVTVEYRWADNQLDRLPTLAAELIQRQVAVLVGNSLAAAAAKAVTTTVPIVFVSGDDPVKSGLVASLNRPSANLTGVTFFGGSQLNAKRLELLHDLVPKVPVMGVLVDPNYTAFLAEMSDVEATARAIGIRLVVVEARTPGEFDEAFNNLVKGGIGALMVSGGPFFTSERRAIVALAAHYRIPAIYDLRESVDAGGLMSYSASFKGAYQQAGIYAGRILNGAKPSELPVLQPTTFELAINLKTAKVLGLDIPPSIMLRADEVIE